MFIAQRGFIFEAPEGGVLNILLRNELNRDLSSLTINIWLLTERVLFGRVSAVLMTDPPALKPFLGHPNGLIPSHLALKVAPQETHSIVLTKKVTTRY